MFKSDWMTECACVCVSIKSLIVDEHRLTVPLHKWTSMQSGARGRTLIVEEFRVHENRGRERETKKKMMIMAPLNHQQ